MTQLSKNASMVSPQFKNHIHFNEYLVDGVLHTWNGATSEVYSTIHSEGKDGQVGPTLLGSIPDMETDAALAALGAAEKAYNRGQGV